MLAIFKREMRSYFTGIIGYAFLVIYLAAAGVLFAYTTLFAMTANVTTYFTLMLIFAAVILPILTMKSFSEERKTKTEQLILTAPVSIPGMVVISPADDVEAKAAVKAAYEYEGPVYLRFGRLAVPVFHSEDYKFEIGKGEVLKEGTDVAIIANGLLTYEAIVAGEELAKEGINAMIINMPTIKPLDEELVLEAAKKCGKVITCEEHSIIGGLGEAVCAVLSEKLPTPVKRIGVNDEFGHSGPAVPLLKQFGLSWENIVKTAKEMCGK